jgi:hypothetical protein
LFPVLSLLSREFDVESSSHQTMSSATDFDSVSNSARAIRFVQRLPSQRYRSSSAAIDCGIDAEARVGDERPERHSMWLRLDKPQPHEVYNCSMLLLRGNLHIAWRGNGAPENPIALAAMTTGHLSR